MDYPEECGYRYVVGDATVWETNAVKVCSLFLEKKR